MSDMSCTLAVCHVDGRREIVSEAMPLKAAADAAFAMADDLSRPGMMSDIREIATVDGEKLQLSITIRPGVALIAPR